MEHHDEHDHLPGMDDISAEDMRELLEEAIADGAIVEGQPSYGIAQAMLAEDQPHLTSKQHEIFDRHVAPVLSRYAERLVVQRRTDSMPD